MLQLDDIRDGDTVRLRNGETIVVDSRSAWYQDREGRHDGPFVYTKPGHDHYLLADVVEVVVRNERLCRFCGGGITSTVAETDFCRGCFYTGTYHEDLHSDLIGRLGDIDEVATVSVWHTGGGCFLLAVKFGDESLATMDAEFALPEGDEPWNLIVLAPNQQAWDDWDENALDVRNGEWTADQLVLEVAEIAKGRGSKVVELDAERQYREELRSGRDPRD